MFQLSRSSSSPEFQGCKANPLVRRYAGNVLRSGLSQSSEANVGAWGGYSAQVMVDEVVNTVLTLNNDFERFDAFDTKVILSPANLSS